MRTSQDSRLAPLDLRRAMSVLALLVLVVAALHLHLAPAPQRDRSSDLPPSQSLVTASLGVGPSRDGDVEHRVLANASRSLRPRFVEELDEEGAFRLRGMPGMEVVFRPGSIVYALRGGGDDRDRANVISLEIIGSRKDVQIEGVGRAAGRVNVFRGSDPSAWRRDLSIHEEIVYRDVYPGIDLRFHYQDGRLKSEWHLAAHRSSEEISWRYRGASGVRVDEQGFLCVEAELGELTESPPLVHQPGSDVEISACYVVGEDGTVGYWVSCRDPALPLVIDPGLEWSTYLGGSNADFGQDIAVDRWGSVYVLSKSWSIDFPTTPGAFDETFGGGIDGDTTITKFDRSGSLVYSTYLGGSRSDPPGDLVVDEAGNVYVVGGTDSEDFPTTPGAFDTTHNGQFTTDVFVAKLDAQGAQLLYSTFIGGSSSDGAAALFVDASGSAYVTGNTHSLDYPTTPGAFDTVVDRSDAAFVTKLDPTGSQLEYSTILEGVTGGIVSQDLGFAIAVDATGSACVAGVTDSTDFPTTPGAFDTTQNGSLDIFVSKLDPTGSSLIYSTFIGGSGRDVVPFSALALDGSDVVYLTGATDSPDFPATSGAFDSTYNGGSTDAIVLALDSTGSSLLFSTFLGTGGTGNFDGGNGAALDSVGNIYIAGTTTSGKGFMSRPFPTTPGAFDTSYNGGGTDGFLSVFEPTGSALLYSSFFGGDGNDRAESLALDAAGTVHLTGITGSSDLPTTEGAFDRTPNGNKDSWAARLRLSDPTLAFNGTPSAGSSVHYTLSGAPPGQTGATAQVALSCSGTTGIPLPANSGLVLPLTLDTCTLLSLAVPHAFSGTIDSSGNAQTPAVPFPKVPSGITVYSAAFTWTFGVGFFSVTPPITFVTQ